MTNKKKSKLTNFMVLNVAVLFLLCSNHKSFQSLEKSFYTLERNFIAQNVLANSISYDIAETPYSKIYYIKEDEEYVRFIGRNIDLYFPAMQKNFGLEKIPKAIFILYPDEKLLKETINSKNSIAPMGAYYGGVIHILSPRLWAGASESDIKDRFLKDGPIVHELAHYMLDMKAEGNFDTWFTEGVALYYEYKYTGTQWRPDLKHATQQISYGELKKDFASMDNSISYRKAFEIVNNIVLQKGEESLQQIIYALSIGESFETACGK